MEKTRIFQLAVKMENDAFESSQGEEVARILRKIADTVEREALLVPGHCSIRDYNGNNVGTYEAF